MNTAFITILTGLFLLFASPSSFAIDRTAKSYANEASQYFNKNDTASLLRVCILWDKELPSFQSSFNLAFAYLKIGDLEKANNQIAELEKQYKALTEAQKQRLNTLQKDIRDQLSYTSRTYTSRTYTHIQTGDITLSVKNNEDGFGASRGGSKDLMGLSARKERSSNPDGIKPSTEAELIKKASEANLIEEYTPPPPIPTSVPEIPD